MSIPGTQTVTDWLVQPTPDGERWMVRRAGQVVSRHQTQEAAKNAMMRKASSGDVIELRGTNFQTIWARQKR